MLWCNEIKCDGHGTVAMAGDLCSGEAHAKNHELTEDFVYISGAVGETRFQ